MFTLFMAQPTAKSTSPPTASLAYLDGANATLENGRAPRLDILHTAEAWAFPGISALSLRQGGQGSNGQIGAPPVELVHTSQAPAHDGQQHGGQEDGDSESGSDDGDWHLVDGTITYCVGHLWLGILASRLMSAHTHATSWLH